MRRGRLKSSSAIFINLFKKEDFMRILMSLLIAIFLMGGQAVASTPDGETPAVEEVCAGQVGAAYGLCNA